jgi:transposase-like protein
LEGKYAIVFMDAVHFHVREDNRTVKKAVYVAIGTKLTGEREVLGMWIGDNESAKYWLGVLNEIKNRGVEDIMIVSVDGLTGFGDAITGCFPESGSTTLHRTSNPLYDKVRFLQRSEALYPGSEACLQSGYRRIGAPGFR